MICRVSSVTLGCSVWLTQEDGGLCTHGREIREEVCCVFLPINTNSVTWLTKQDDRLNHAR